MISNVYSKLPIFIVKSKQDPAINMIFTDMLNDYRRVKDHALNIAEVLSGEK